MPVISPASNRDIARSSDFWRLLLILWQIKRFRSIERPSSWTCRWRSRVTYLKFNYPQWIMTRVSFKNMTGFFKINFCFFCLINLTIYLFGGGVLIKVSKFWHSCLNLKYKKYNHWNALRANWSFSNVSIIIVNNVPFIEHDASCQMFVICIYLFA